MRRHPRDYGEATRARRAPPPSLERASVAGAGASVGDSSSGGCFSAVMWTFLLTGVAVAGAMIWLHRDEAERGRHEERHRQRWLRPEEREREHEHARVTEA